MENIAISLHPKITAYIGRSYRLSRLLPPFDEVAALAAAVPELDVDLRGGAEDDLDDVGGVATEEIDVIQIVIIALLRGFT